MKISWGRAIKTKSVSVFVMILSIMTTTPNALAGGLLGFVNERLEDNVSVKISQLKVQAAQERIAQAKSDYLPQLALEAASLRINQDIEQDGSGLFRRGESTFDSQRTEAMLTLPLLDFSLKPKLLASQAYSDSVAANARQNDVQVRADLIKQFVNLSLALSDQLSYERVVALLEKEVERVTKQVEVKVASIADLEAAKIKLINSRNQARANKDLLAAMREASATSSNQSLRYVLSDAADYSFLEARKLPSVESHPALAFLRSETELLKQRARLKKRELLPTVSLRGGYRYDDADDSVFGLAREIEDYEIGVFLRWNFDMGGRGKSEYREAKYLWKAKQLELEQLQNSLQRQEMSLKRSIRRSLQEFTDSLKIAQSQAKVSEALQRNYRAGQTSYLASLDAIVVAEARARQQSQAGHQAIVNFTELLASFGQLNDSDIEFIDSLFESI